MTGYLRRDLHKFALSDNWDLAQFIYNEYPHMVLWFSKFLCTLVFDKLVLKWIKCHQLGVIVSCES